MKSSLKKNFIWNMIGTTFSSFNSLFFMIIVTRVNGVNDAGIFTFAFSTACLFYVIGAYSGRTYQVTEVDKKLTDSDYFYTKLLTCFIMLIISILFCLIRGYDLYKFIIIMELIIYKIIEAFSESPYAVLQKNNELYKVGKSLFYKAVISLLMFLVVDILTKNLMLSSLMIIIFNIIVLLFYDFKNLRGINFKLDKVNYSKVKELLKKGFFTFGFTFLTSYVINAPKYGIDALLNNESQTIFGIIAMPATILILFGQYIIQPFLIMLKETLKANIKNFVKLTLKISGVLLLFGLLCIIICYFMGIPVLELLYGISLSKYLWHLIIIIIGAVLYAISVVFSTALTTMRYTLCQFVIFVITTIFAGIMSFVLIKNYSIFGACMTYASSMLLLLVLYIVIFIISVTKYSNKNELLK